VRVSKSSIVSTEEENRKNFCKALIGKTLFSALYCRYRVAVHELKVVLKANTSGDQSTTPKSAATQENFSKKSGSASGTAKVVLTAVSAAIDTPFKEVATRNFFVPLRACDMDTDSTNESSPFKATAPAKTGRPPPIVLTSAVYIILLQKQLKRMVSENFELRRTRNGTRVITRSMADLQSMKPTSTGKTCPTTPTPNPKSP
jgi:hypothetical protein